MYILLLIFASIPSLALQTAYVNCDHPDGWLCEKSQGVYICQDTQDPQRKESLVLAIATVQTDWDSLENFEKYLKEPRKIEDEDRSILESKITYTRKRNLNGHWWVDSLQFNSELPGFWTRYVATVHKKLAILLTYIVSDEYYQRVAPKFERMVTSLKLNENFDLTAATKQELGFPGAERLGPKQQKDLLKARLSTKKKKETTPTSGLPTMVLIGLGIFIIVYFLFIRKRGV